MIKFLEKYFSSKQGKPGYYNPVVLHDGERTKKSAQLMHIVHEHGENDGLALDLLKFDKPPKTEWPEDIPPTKEISLGEKEVKILYDYLSDSYASIGVRDTGKYAIIPLSGEVDVSQKDLLAQVVNTALRDPELFQKISKLKKSQEWGSSLITLEG